MNNPNLNAALTGRMYMYMYIYYIICQCLGDIFNVLIKWEARVRCNTKILGSQALRNHTVECYWTNDICIKMRQQPASQFYLYSGAGNSVNTSKQASTLLIWVFLTTYRYIQQGIISMAVEIDFVNMFDFANKWNTLWSKTCRRPRRNCCGGTHLSHRNIPSGKA